MTIITPLLLLSTATSVFSTDVCDMKFDPGPCKGMENVVAFEDGKCLPKIYGGCRGNGNRFSSITECESTCSSKLTSRFSVKKPFCETPAEEGMCRGYFTRFTFNAALGKCEQFVYGGCGGGENLFVSMTDCVSACMVEDQPAPAPVPRSITSDTEEDEEDICLLPPVLPGPLGCLGFAVKWSYSRTEGGCVRVTYGGCGATENLFDSQEQCEERCGQVSSSSRTAEVCSLPISPGPCRSFKDTFGFNSLTGRCEQFKYGGCRGNGNRFSTLEDCVSTCGGSEPVSGSQCSGVQCRNNKHKLVEAKGCKPVTRPGECCPSSWDCTPWERRLERPDQCWARGQFYSPGERVAAMTEENPCLQDCHCSARPGQSPEIVCASVDCLQPRQFSLDNCRPDYKDLSSCCATNFTCGEALQEKPTCELEGKTYYSGEKMYPESDPCAVCHCLPGWDGRVGGEFCQEVKCSFLGQEEKMMKGCQPVYQDNVCCPTDWICPGELASSPSVVQDRPVTNPCEQEKEKGPCRASMPRWFYNKQTMTCQEFRFGGCRGNDNNFKTEAECEQKCSAGRTTDLSSLSIDFSTLPANLPSMADPRRRGCAGCPTSTPVTPEIKMVAAKGVKKLSSHSSVTSGGCNKVILKDIADVKTQVVAGINYIFSMTIETRSGMNCDNKVSRTCSGIYIYKPLGCNPADDCLQLIRQDEISCDPVDTSDEETDPCFQERMVGRCKGAFNRFYFDAETKTCRSFLYGGCLGNGNNFADERSCQQTCGRHMTQATPRSFRPTPVNQICQLPMEAGPCYALKPRFFFNFQTRRCEEFIYGGCRGNENNFQSMQECVSACGKHPRGLARSSAPAMTEPSCQFGNSSYSLGSVVRLAGGDCRTCACLSPPDLTCSVTRCPMKAFLPPPGGVNCVMQKDPLGCCDTGYKCDSVTPPVLGGGGFPVLGGYGGSEPLGHEQKLIAATATKKILTGVSGVTECGDLTLLEVTHFSRQVVAGTNFKLSLRLRTRCSETEERICQNIVLFRPLPFRCSPTADNNHCLTLSSPEDISCSPV